jgi:hypothetical protein
MKILGCEGLLLFLVLEWGCVAPPAVEALLPKAITRGFPLVPFVSITRHATPIVALAATRRRNKADEPQQAVADTSPFANNNTDRSCNSSSPRYRHRHIQSRRKPVNRRPKYFWSNVTNLELELRGFWKSVQVTIRDNEPVPIPNEALLNYCQRFDIKAAIVTHGGREDLSFLLGGSRIMAGKWNKAVATSPELQQLLLQNSGLSPDLPPSSPQQKTKKETPKTTKGQKPLSSTPNYDTDNNYNARKSERWSHKTGRKESGYWNDPLVIEELYVFQTKGCASEGSTEPLSYKMTHSLAGWFPSFSLLFSCWQL